MLSLSVGPNHTKAPGWGISFVYPVIDVVSTMIQVGSSATIFIFKQKILLKMSILPMVVV